MIRRTLVPLLLLALCFGLGLWLAERPGTLPTRLGLFASVGLSYVFLIQFLVRAFGPEVSA